MKDISCGVVITNGSLLLSIVPWGKKHQRDIPKGHVEKGEEYVTTAVREVFEETGLQLNPEELDDLGHFEYTHYKDLHLFLYETEALPSISQMKCSSSFTNELGQDVLEAVGFEYLSFHDPKFYPKLQPILRSIGEALLESEKVLP